MIAKLIELETSHSINENPYLYIALVDAFAVTGKSLA